MRMHKPTLGYECSSAWLCIHMIVNVKSEKEPKEENV